MLGPDTCLGSQLNNYGLVGLILLSKTLIELIYALSSNYQYVGILL
jgi:hypothetical protein